MNEALADELQRQGVTAIFGLYGEDVIKLGVELERRGITYYGTRHEWAAVGMADGYARLTGELAVALISRGPGVTNALTGLVTAAKARNPVVVIAGDSDPLLRGSNYSKYVDQAAIFRGAGVPHVTLDSPETAVADFAAICERARSGVLIVANLPGEILEAEAGDAPSTAVLPEGRPAPREPDPAQISSVADLLGETWMFRRPVLLCGRGAARSDAEDELQRLAGSCGAVLATTLMAKGLFDGDPYSLGIAGTYASEPAAELLAEADVLLAFGASLDRLTTLEGALFPNARVIRFDHDPGVEEKGSIPVEVFVEGDVRLSARALADELDRRGHREVGYRTQETAAKIAGFRPGDTIVDQSRPGALDPRVVMLRLDELLPRERTLVIDNGHHQAFSVAHLSVPDAKASISPLEFQCVGAATSMALAAPIACPDRLTVYCAGDCGLLMTLGELETAARYRLPMLIVVMNDAALGAEVQYLRALGLPDAIAHCPTPSFEAVARALGMEACTVETLEDLEQVSGLVERLDGPVLVDCKVTPDVRADWVEFVMLRNRKPATAAPATAG